MPDTPQAVPSPCSSAKRSACRSTAAITQTVEGERLSDFSRSSAEIRAAVTSCGGSGPSSGSRCVVRIDRYAAWEEGLICPS